jgi:hypothetical protein
MTNPFGMTDEEFLDCLGPSWAELVDVGGERQPLVLSEAPRHERPISDRAKAARERLKQVRA